MSGAVTGHPIGIKAGDFVCQHPDHAPDQPTWCEHLSDAIQLGQDSILWEPLHTYHIPVFPTLNKFAIIRLMEPLSGNIKMCEMKMLYTPDIGRGYEVELGFWIEGDGAKSIRSVIVDYIRSQTDAREVWVSTPHRIYTECPNSAHSFASQNKLNRNCLYHKRLEVWWDMVFEKACTFCIEESADNNNNFGLGAV